MISRRLTVALTPVMFLVAAPGVFALVPWLISRLVPHASSPILVGLVPVGAGVAVLAWVMVTMLRQMHELPERMDVDWTPKFLVLRGPYAFSRNPIYLAEDTMWLGWSIFHGSLLVAACVVIVFAGQSLLIWREEQDLKARFGDAYRDYVARVPRWIGRTRTRRSTA
jgi:protein-S-isoprenylcysteine O-methyltransferase Ste14